MQPNAPRHNTIEAYIADAMLIGATYHTYDHVMLDWTAMQAIDPDTLEPICGLMNYTANMLEIRIGWHEAGIIGIGGTGSKPLTLRGKVRRWFLRRKIRWSKYVLDDHGGWIGDR